jgi:ribosomal protein S18 acetylase RimI-like enzyme
MLIRLGENSDLPFVERVSREAFEKYGNAGLCGEMWGHRLIQRFVAQASGKNLGFAMMCVREDPNHRGKSIADFMALAVDTRIRRRGVGRELTERVIDAAKVAMKELPVVAVEANCAEDNEPIHALLKSFGFEWVRRGEYVVYPNGTRMLTLAKPLCEVAERRATVRQTA